MLLPHSVDEEVGSERLSGFPRLRSPWQCRILPTFLPRAVVKKLPDAGKLEAAEMYSLTAQEALKAGVSRVSLPLKAVGRTLLASCGFC